MPDQFDSPSVPSVLQRIAGAFRLAGWIGFWFQLVLGIVSTIIFLFAIPSAQPRTTVGSPAGNPGTGGSIFFAVCGLLVLYFSVYQAFKYTRIALKLQDPNPNLRPKKADTIQVLRFGLIVSLVGMLLTVLGAEAITGTLLGKSLAQAQGVAIYDPQFINRVIQPLDIFVVLANTHTVTAHFVGLITSIYLLNRINRS
jgi:hypothetical protein